MKPATIVRITARDIRFPTSRHQDGSDAIHKDPDYSCAYVTLHTDEEGLEGHGITFTLGRGTELCVAAVESLKGLVIGRTIESIASNFRGFWRSLAHDSQLRWVGPEKGVLHLATAALVNAVWDLYAKKEKKPVWKLVADMTPEQFVACVDFRHITDALTPEEALSILKANAATKPQREAELLKIGLPAYTTSAGWLGYSDDKMRKLLHHYMAKGWRRFKMKVGVDIADDARRAKILREEIGSDGWLMVDANQVWEVDEAIAHMKQLAPFTPVWIEEPTSPDDVLGHAKIARGIAPIGVATGEMCQNRVMFKQFLEAGAMQFCQIDSCRLGGVNEVLAVLLLAAKFKVPVCPHAGGVGLCNYVQHLAAINYICVAPSLDKVVVEYADHLNEHFFDPVKLREGRYILPGLPGYSISMKPDSLDAHEFPGGREWRK